MPSRPGTNGWRSRIPQSVFVRNFAKTLQGSVVGQLLVVVSIPFLARLYPPESFALLQAGVGVIALATALSCLRYDAALTVCSDKEVAPLLKLIGVVGPIVSVLLAIGLVLVPTAWLAGLGLLSLKPVAGWFAVSILVASFGNAISFIAIRLEDFGTLARAKIVQSVGFVLGAVCLGGVGIIASGLLIADVVGRALLLAVLVIAVLSASNFHKMRSSWREVRQVLVQYRWFPLISLPGSVISAIGGSFTTIWMLALFTAHDAGAYAMVERFVVAPVGLIGAALQQVYQGRFSASLRAGHDDLGRNFIRLLAILALLSLPGLLLLVFVAPTILPLILGDQWQGAARFCQVLAPSIAASFLVVPFNMILTLLQKQRLQLSWEVGRFLVVTGTWLIASRMGLSPLETLAAVSSMTAASLLAFLVVAYIEVTKVDAAARERFAREKH